MHRTLKGIVIGRKAISGDLILTILTESKETIKAYFKNAKTVKGRAQTSSLLLCYSTFELFYYKGRYTVNDAFVIEEFKALRYDVLNLALGSYFAALATQFSQGERSGELLKLLLNSLHFLCKGKDPKIIKSIFELRAASLAGFMPDIVSCAGCGEYTDTKFYFDFKRSSFFCTKCSEKESNISKNVIETVRFIIFSDLKTTLSVKASDELRDALSAFSESLIVSIDEIDYKQLTYYHNLRRTTDEFLLKKP